MEAGIELDTLVTDKAMNGAPKLIAIATSDNGKSCAVSEHWDGPFPTEQSVIDWVKEHPHYKLDYWKNYEPYSTDISFAWEIVKKLQKYNPFWEKENAYLDFSLSPTEGGLEKEPGWMCNFGDDTTMGFAPTLPHAICLAALKAVGHKF